jgi:hypothetical protein
MSFWWQESSTADVWLVCHLGTATRLPETGESRGMGSGPRGLTTDWSMSGEIPDSGGVTRKCTSPSATTGSHSGEAGKNAGQRRTRRRHPCKQGAMVSASEGPSEPSSGQTGPREFRGLDQKVRDRGQRRCSATGRHSHETRRTGPTYGTAKRSIGTREPPSVLSSAVDTTSRRPGRMPVGGGFAREANAWGNARDRLTRARSDGG